MKMCGLLKLFLLMAIHAAIGFKSCHLETVFEWNLLEYGFPSAADQQQAIADGNLIINNGIPIDVAPFYNNGRPKIFTTIPRFQTGIPYTLAVVTKRSGENGPIIKAYPSYDWHTANNCDGITSAFRVAITECNQMWVIDSGVIGTEQHCPPQLLLFDLQSDQLLHRYRFDSKIYTPSASLFITPIALVHDPPPTIRHPHTKKSFCQHTILYIADVTNHGLVIYDFHQDKAWRAEHRFMYPNPVYGTHSIADEEFTLMDGIFGMTTDKKNLYFHPLASIGEFSVPLSVLNNSTNWEVEGSADMSREFRHLGDRESECAAQAIDSRGNVFCVTFKPIKLISWNVNSAYKANNLREISANEQILQFVSGMKVVKNHVGKEELWMISNRYQKIAAGTQNPNEVNFRILKLQIADGQNTIEQEKSTVDLHNHLIFN